MIVYGCGADYEKPYSFIWCLDQAPTNVNVLGTDDENPYELILVA